MFNVSTVTIEMIINTTTSKFATAVFTSTSTAANDIATDGYTASTAAAVSDVTADTASAASDDDYDGSGAMKYLVTTLGVYALLGILSLMLVRIIRRAKLRLKCNHASGKAGMDTSEEYNSVRKYLRRRQELQLEAHRQKLMHEKTKTALTMWRTDIPSLTKPLLVHGRHQRNRPRSDHYNENASSQPFHRIEHSSTQAAHNENASSQPFHRIENSAVQAAHNENASFGSMRHHSDSENGSLQCFHKNETVFLDQSNAPLYSETEDENPSFQSSRHSEHSPPQSIHPSEDVSPQACQRGESVSPQFSHHGNKAPL